MEAKTAPPPIYNDRDRERGAGGKFKKPSSRKPPAGPYARPLDAPGNKSGRGGWLAKLVDPAYRLISGSATRIIPSFFSKPPSNALPLLPITKSNEDEVIPSEKDEEKCTSSLAIVKSNERKDADELLHKEKGISQDGKLGQDMPESSHDDYDISRIEQLVKGKNFSREEILRLTEILKSKVTDDLERDKPRMPSGRNTEGDLLLRNTPRKLTERSQEDVNGAQLGPLTPLSQTNGKDEIGASPIDVAKAFMGTRMSDQSPRHRSSLTKGERDPENAYKSFFPSPLPKSSPRWPGTTVSEHQGYTTPQNQRSRYGLHDFPRTPYSRTLLSKSRTNSRSFDLSGKSSQQSPLSTTYGQEKTTNDVFDYSYGSVGPIRRIRNKLGSEARSGKSIFLNPSKAASANEKPFAPKTFLPTFGKNKETGQTGETSKSNAVDHEKGVPNEASRIILEHFNRHKPTPKEKAYELKLATDWNKPSSLAQVSAGAKPTESAEVKTTELGPTTSFLKSNSNAGPLVTANPEKDLAANTSGTKPALASIDISKPGLRRGSVYSDNGFGFTFPVPASSGAFSEPPPTPSMPSSASKDLPGVPSYSFGSGKPSRRIVFSFPSTSSASVPAELPDIKFDFGVDGKTQLCFSAVGKAVI